MIRLNVQFPEYCKIIYFNPRHISTIQDCEKGGYVTLAGEDTCFYTKETAEQIINLIENANKPGYIPLPVLDSGY